MRARRNRIRRSGWSRARKRRNQLYGGLPDVVWQIRDAAAMPELYWEAPNDPEAAVACQK